MLGPALRKAVALIAQDPGASVGHTAEQWGADVLQGSSLKAALDIDWEDATAKSEALAQVIAALDAVEFSLPQGEPLNAPTVAAVNEQLITARELQSQDVEPSQEGTPRLKKSVAKDRRITIEDEQMRHGRKSRSVRIDGYKRHVLSDLELQMIRVVGITAANAPEASVTQSLAVDWQRQAVPLAEWHIDRADLSSDWGQHRGEELDIFCKAWPTGKGERFAKTAFEFDWSQQQLTCPHGMTVSLTPGKVARFPPFSLVVHCPLKGQCTTSEKGRSVSIHADEAFFAQLRERQSTPEGPAQLQERVKVEHT